MPNSWDIPIKPTDLKSQWKISPEVQAERDRRAKELIDEEKRRGDFSGPDITSEDIGNANKEIGKLGYSSAEIIKNPNLMPDDFAQKVRDKRTKEQTINSWDNPIDLSAITTNSSEQPINSWDTPVDPSLLDFASQGFHQGIASLARGVGAASTLIPLIEAGLAGDVSQTTKDLTQTVFEYMRKRAEELDNHTKITPEQNASITLPQKVAGFVGGSIPLLASAPFGMAPALGVTAISSLGRKAEEVEQGESTAGSVISGAMQVMADTIANSVPFYGGTIVKAAISGAATNVISGFSTDILNRAILRETGDKEFASKYKPYDFDQRFLEGVFGAGFGAGAKHFEQLRGISRSEAIVDLFGDSLVQTEADLAFLNVNTKKYNFQPFIDSIRPEILRRGPEKEKQYEMAFNILLREIITNQWKDENGYFPANEDKAKVLLDFIRQYADAGSYQTQAAYLISLYEFLDTAPINIIQHPNHFLLNDWSNRNQEMRLGSAGNTYILLHEVQHMLHNGAVIWTKMVDNLPANQAAKELNSPTARKIFDTIKTFEKIFDSYKDQIQAKTKYKNENRNPREPERDIYGTKNLDEFLSELTTNPEFKDILKNIKVYNSQARDFLRPLEIPAGIKHVYNAGIEMSKLGDTNLFDVSTYAYANLVDLLTRGNRLNVSDGDTGFKATIKSIFGSGVDLEKLDEHFGQTRSLAQQFSDYHLRKIGQILSQAGDATGHLNIDGVITKLSSMFPQQSWKEFIGRNINKIIFNGPKIIKIYDDFAVTTKTGLLQDPRTIDRIFDSLFENKMPTVGDDISSKGTYIMGGDQLAMIKDKTNGGLLLKAIDNKINEYRRMKAQLYYDFLEFQKPFTKLKTQERINVMEASSFFDSYAMRKQLQSRGLQWPDDDMLRVQRLSEREIAAYKSLTRGYDYMYTALNGAASTDPQLKRQDGSQFLLPRIPGFMPHFHDGVVKVFLDVQNGTDTLRLLRGFHTIVSAERFVKSIRDRNHPDVKIIQQLHPGQAPTDWIVQTNRSPAQGISSTIIEHYHSFENFQKLTPALANVITQLDTQAARGWNKSLMKRNDVGGYITDVRNPYGEAMKSYLGIPNRAAQEAFALYQRYARSVSDYTANAHYVNDVYKPLMESSSVDNPRAKGVEMSEMKNLTRYLEEQSRNFTGENINKLDWVDKFAEDMGIKVKLNPWVVKDLVRASRALLSVVKLRTPRNWWANLQQPFNGIGILYHFALEHGLVTEGSTKATNSPIASLMWAYKELLFQQSPEGKFALDWSISKHSVSPQQDQEVGRGPIHGILGTLNTAALGRINPSVEGFGRKVSFLMAYKWGKEIYGNKINALEFADRATRVIMVNYDRAARPHMFQNLGLLGESISPFAVYRNAYLGNTYVMARDLVRQPSKFESYKPLIVSQFIYMAMAGMLGIIAIQEYNTFVDFFNGLIPESVLQLPHFEALSMKYGFPDWLTFGVTSEATKNFSLTPEGFYIGQSATAPNVVQAMEPPLFPFIQALIIFGLVPIKEGLRVLDIGPGASTDELYTSIKILTPPQLVPYLDRLVSNDSAVGPRANSVEGYVDRSQSSMNSMIAMGSVSLEEWKDRRAEELVNRRVMTMKKYVKGYVDKAANNALGLPSGMDADKAYDKASQENPNLDKAEFDKMVEEEILTRLTSKKTRDNKTNSGDSYFKQKIREEYGR